MTKFNDQQLRDVTITVSSVDENDYGEPFAVTTMYKLEIEATGSELGYFMDKVGCHTEVVHGPESMKPTV